MSFIVKGGGLLVTELNSIERSFGLLTSVKPVSLSDPHWQSGLEWESDCVARGFSTVLSCDVPPFQKDPDGGLVHCSATPFTVTGSYKCSTGGRSAADPLKIAKNRLKNNKERDVEYIFWTGNSSVGPISPSLQGGNETCDSGPIDITPVSGPLNPVAAIAALESNIAECVPGGVGVIHVNFGVLSYLTNNYLAVERNGKFYTPTGQLIVAGAGYPGSGPGNVPASPGQTWVFATGPVAVYNGDEFYTPSTFDQAVDRIINNVTFFAEQTYAVIWECCSFAVRMSLC